MSTYIINAQTISATATDIEKIDMSWSADESKKISILEKASRLTELQDPELIDIDKIQHLSNNLGYNINVNRDEVGGFGTAFGIPTSTELATSGVDAERYLRFMASNLPNIYKIKTTDNDVQLMLYTFGLVGDFIRYYTGDRLTSGTDYSDAGSWLPDTEKNLKFIPNTHYTTPHFSLTLDMDQSESLDDDTEKRKAVIRAVDSIRPANTVFRKLTGYILRDFHTYVAMKTNVTKYMRIYRGESYVAPPTSYKWVSQSNIKNWRDVSVSNNGAKQIAVENYGGIYISTDYGTSWNKTAEPSSNEWLDNCRVSYDGNVLIAGGEPENQSDWLWLSTDGGTNFVRQGKDAYLTVSYNALTSRITRSSGNWTTDGFIAGKIFTVLPVSPSSNTGWYRVDSVVSNTIISVVPLTLTMVTETSRSANFRWGANRWAGIAMSNTGKHITVVADYQGRGQIMVSHTSGTTWNDTGGFGGAWADVCMSSGGNIQYAIVDGLKTYKSTTSGDTWVQLTATAVNVSRKWSCCRCSKDGVYVLFGVRSGGKLYVSSDSGVNFTEINISKDWHCCTMSDNGSRMIAGNYGGEIWASFDYGVNWSKQNVESQMWTGMQMTGNGTAVTAVGVLNFVTPRVPGKVYTATLV